MVTSDGMPVHEVAVREVPVHSPAPVPDGVLDAFWRYDAALLANDRAVLDELFMAGPDTVRGDGRVLLVGHEAIAGFRSGRAVIPTRKVAELQVRVLAPDAVLIMARTDGRRSGAGSRRRSGSTPPTAGGSPPRTSACRSSRSLRLVPCRRHRSIPLSGGWPGYRSSRPSAAARLTASASRSGPDRGRRPPDGWRRPRLPDRAVTAARLGPGGHRAAPGRRAPGRPRPDRRVRLQHRRGEFALRHRPQPGRPVPARRRIVERPGCGRRPRPGPGRARHRYAGSIRVPAAWQASSASARRTGPCRPTACCRWPRRSIPSAGSPATSRRAPRSPPS